VTDPDRLAFYDSPEGAEEYLDEYRKLHRKLSDRRERRILQRYFARMDGVRSVLDLPCGWGRYLPTLRSAGAWVLEADASTSMLKTTRRLHDPKPDVVRCFGHEVPLADDAVDLVFSMRLNHHLVDPEVRRGHVRELFRVARRFAVFTYFDAASLKNRLRVLRTRLGLTRKTPKNTLRRAEVRALARDAGWRVVADPMLFVVGSGHRLVLAEPADA